MIGMRMGMGLGAPMQGVSGSAATPAIFTINNANNQYMRIRVNTTTTLAVTGTVTIGTSPDPIGTSLEIIAGGDFTGVYVKGTGTIVCEDASYITYLYLYNTGTSITGSITGMPLTYLYLYNTGTSITGTITGMEITYLYLYNTGTSITGTITGMEITYLYLYNTGTSITGSIGGMPLGTLLLNGTGSSITGDISGMQLATLNLNNTGSSIYGTPAQIGIPLSSLKIYDETTYVYPWTSQTFGGTARKWGGASMSIDCNAQAPTVEVFDKWLKDLASVSLPGTATLVLKNTPTANDLAADGKGQYNVGSGLYQMMALGYTMSLGQ